MMSASRSSNCRLCEPALLEGALVVLLDHPETLVERRLRGLEHRHPHACIGEVHGDPAAHGPRADHGHRSDGARRRARGDVGNLARRARCEKDVPQRLGHGALQELRERRSLDLDALLERLEHRRLDGVDAFGGRGIMPRERSNRAARKIEKRLRVRQDDRDVARFLQGQLAARRISRKRQSGGHDVGIDHPIEQRRLRELARVHRISAHDHVERALCPRKAR